jgi:hypothetical protein
MHKLNLFFILPSVWLSIFFLPACTKVNIEVIDGNAAPPDSTIETVVLENYINKLYIGLLGRKPLDEELDESLEILRQNNASFENREKMVNTVFEKEGYYQRIFDIAFSDLLSSVDTGYFVFLSYDYAKLLETLTDPNAIEALNGELEEIQAVLNILVDFQENGLRVTDMYKRLVDNDPYDEINMGTENFILSLFQYFLNRYPTDSELENATLMINGNSSVLFYEEGDSKDDFIKIFFNQHEYYEGQVMALYERYLYRKPDSEEMTLLANSYKTSEDYQALQRAILITEEYSGIFYD